MIEVIELYTDEEKKIDLALHVTIDALKPQLDAELPGIGATCVWTTPNVCVIRGPDFGFINTLYQVGGDVLLVATRLPKEEQHD